MSSTKTARWLDLIAFLLQRRYPVSRREIFGQVAAYRRKGSPDDDARTAAEGDGEEWGGKGLPESARRMFERDKDELRKMGIAIETVRLPHALSEDGSEGYGLAARDFYLPCFDLEGSPVRSGPYRSDRFSISGAELELLDRATARLAERSELPLAAAARAARRKLAFDLPIEVDVEPRVLAHPLPAEGEKTLETLQNAVAMRRAVSFQYYSISRDTESERTLEPYGLLFTLGQWYATGRDRDRDAMRMFRLDRMRSVREVAGDDGTFVVPADFSLRDLSRRAPWELGNDPAESVRVRFRFPDARWVAAQGLGAPAESERDTGEAVLDFAVRDRGPFLRWLLTFRDQVEVLGHDGVAGELQALRDRVMALYE